MKKRLLILSLLISSASMFSQSSGFNEVSENNITTGMHSNGNLFFSEGLTDGYFIAPNTANEPQKTTIYSSGLWMGGIDPVGNLSSAVVAYDGNDFEQYISGPLNASEIDISFDKVWKVTKSEILAHLLDFQDGNIDNPLSSGIEQWPGNGNAFYTPALPVDQTLAPYYDADANGVYNPNKGDFPIIDYDLIDVIPEELLFTIYNANNFVFSVPLKVEVHAMMYTFNCEENEVLQNTVFTRHKVINKNTAPYQNFKVSLWQDVDLGCSTDDYMGCDSTLNAFFAYNADLIDGDSSGSCPGGINSYEENPPVQSTVFLNQKMESFVVTYNPNLTNAPGGTYEPSSEQQNYENMNGRNRDGTPITIGDFGYNPESTDITKYAFHDDPNDTNGWSMLSDSLSSGDVRSLANAGLETFQPGQIFTLDMAHIFTRVETSNNVETVIDAKLDMQSVQTLYNAKFEETCAISTSVDQLQLDHIKVYPNPSNGTFYISQTGEFNTYMLTDNLGRIITTGAINGDLTQVKTSVAKGTYILKLENKETGEQLQKTLIIQ